MNSGGGTEARGAGVVLRTCENRHPAVGAFVGVEGSRRQKMAQIFSSQNLGGVGVRWSLHAGKRGDGESTNKTRCLIIEKRGFSEAHRQRGIRLDAVMA